MASGEESKSDIATGGASEEEMKLLQALHLLGIKPRLGDTTDVMKLLKAFGGEAKDDPPADTTKAGVFHYPKLSYFYGEEGKGEASWATFKYEVEALQANKFYKEEQILQGIRRSLKGNAGDKLRRLGTKATVDEIMAKLESDYGTVESKETSMRKFYSCMQTSDESIEAYASRLEDLFDKAVKVGALKRTDTGVLKEDFHAGLKKEIKLMTLYQKNRFITYEELKRELRGLEEDMKTEEKPDTKKTCKAAVNTEKIESRTELSEVKDMLKQINQRIDSLEKDKKDHREKPDWYRPSFRGRGRGFRGQQQQYRGRGRGEHRYRRPLGSETFKPAQHGMTCFFCHEEGHFQRNCPKNLEQRVCYRCNKKGHLCRDCPN